MPQKISTRGSGAKKGAQKYQNKFAYTHNKKSKRTQTILSLPVDGLCQRCREIIEWRKRYRKYKPLTAPKKCIGCQEKKVKKAYHVLCDDCAQKQGVCAKCRESSEIIDDGHKSRAEIIKEEQELERKLEGMRERQRRTYMRKLERGEISPEDIPDVSSYGFDDFDFTDSEDESEDGEDTDDSNAGSKQQ